MVDVDKEGAQICATSLASHGHSFAGLFQSGGFTDEPKAVDRSAT
jgi:hypothetical protein